TLVLVTHDMATVQAFCDRAMLIHDGQQRYLGDPEEAALRYYRLNFTGSEDPRDDATDVGIVDAWIESTEGRRLVDVQQGDGFRLQVELEARRELDSPGIGFELLNVDGVSVLGFGTVLEDDEGVPQVIVAGQRIKISAVVDAELVPGRYSILCTVVRGRSRGDTALRDVRLIDFLVIGTDPMPGMIYVRADVAATVQSP
ncbi:MAG TPA: Wzt carbohydrate-binding domain-containing protein, partial [Solirubrobacteraceae bacterium]